MAEDDSGWLDTANGLPETLRPLISELATLYIPYLKLNAEAVLSGAELVDGEVDGRPYQQNPFAYQAKCLQWIGEQYAALFGCRQSAAGCFDRRNRLGRGVELKRKTTVSDNRLPLHIGGKRRCKETTATPAISSGVPARRSGMARSAPCIRFRFQWLLPSAWSAPGRGPNH